LTNNSAPTPRELQSKLQRLGIDVTADHFFTSGQATAYFLKSQMPEVSCQGEQGVENEGMLTYEPFSLSRVVPVS
jgi:NagD protein